MCKGHRGGELRAPGRAAVATLGRRREAYMEEAHAQCQSGTHFEGKETVEEK